MKSLYWSGLIIALINFACAGVNAYFGNWVSVLGSVSGGAALVVMIFDSSRVRLSDYVTIFAWHTPTAAAGWHRFGFWWKPLNNRCIRIHTPVWSVHISFQRHTEADYLGLASDPRLFRWLIEP